MELKPGYKQTEAGIIPLTWKVKRLKEIFSLKSGYAFSSEHYSDKGPILLTPGNFKLDGGLYFNERNTKRYSGTYSSTAKFVYGDLLVVMTDLTPDCNLLGKPAIVHLHEPILHNQRIGKINLLNQQVLPEFLYWYFLSNYHTSRMKETATGSTVRHTSNGSIYNGFICLPPLPEQRAIDAALSDTDALLGSLDRLLAKKRDIKQAVMQQLLTGKQRLPGFGGEWDSRTIEQLEKLGIVKLSRGQVISKKDIESIPGSSPIYSSSVKNDGLFGRYGRFMFDEEMITWSVDGGGHFFYRNKHKFSVTNVCGFMRVDTTKLDYQFLAAQLQLLHSSLTFDYQDKAHPSVIRKAYTISVPPLGEQAAIANVLSDMDAEIDALTQRRDKTRAVKQGMMQELLTGRTRLV